ncbi:MAG: transcriptional repressor [Clostridia bacterium]|nr:transcriptional repressor [Clostridia bacterium]
MSTQRHSKKRDAILECVRNTDSHPTAEWVYTQLKPQFPDLSLGTVYRNLAAFKEEGVITSLGVIDGMERFERERAPHAHFLCRECRKILDVENFRIPESLTAAVDCGEVLESTVMFTGICKECAAKSAS